MWRNKYKNLRVCERHGVTETHARKKDDKVTYWWWVKHRKDDQLSDELKDAEELQRASTTMVLVEL